MVSKVDHALAVITARPELSNEEVRDLVFCSLRTVNRARALWHPATPATPNAEDNATTVTTENPVVLLRDQLIKKCSQDNPDIRALDSLMRLLEKTGKLDILIKEEEECKQELDKLSPADLVSIATGKELHNKPLPQTDSEESLYQ